MKRVYWDSCCFIDYLSGNENGELLKGVVDKMVEGELQIVTSAITIAEVLKLGKGTAEDRKKIVEMFTQDKGILVVDLTKHLAEQARELIWKYSFEKHKWDGIHLATALYINQYHPINEIHTFDHDLLKLNETVGIQIPIIQPDENAYPPKPPTFFDVPGFDEDMDSAS